MDGKGGDLEKIRKKRSIWVVNRRKRPENQGEMRGREEGLERRGGEMAKVKMKKLGGVFPIYGLWTLEDIGKST